MNFFDFDWADSNIEYIGIEYDQATLVVWNDTLQQKMSVECLGFAGVTNLCLWDDTIISTADVSTVTDINNEFLRNLYTAYQKDKDYGGRCLGDGLYELKIRLVNDISFSIYCQEIQVRQADDGSVS